jgi:hypothetical protein
VSGLVDAAVAGALEQDGVDTQTSVAHSVEDGQEVGRSVVRAEVDDDRRACEARVGRRSGLEGEDAQTSNKHLRAMQVEELDVTKPVGEETGAAREVCCCEVRRADASGGDVRRAEDELDEAHVGRAVGVAVENGNGLEAQGVSALVHTGSDKGEEQLVVARLQHPGELAQIRGTELFEAELAHEVEHESLVVPRVDLDLAARRPADEVYLLMRS